MATESKAGMLTFSLERGSERLGYDTVEDGMKSVAELDKAVRRAFAQGLEGYDDDDEASLRVRVWRDDEEVFPLEYSDYTSLADWEQALPSLRALA